MSEFEARKREVGPPGSKTRQQQLVDATYVLGANPDHPEGRKKLEQLTRDPDPVVSAAAREQMYGPPVDDSSDDGDDGD